MKIKVNITAEVTLEIDEAKASLYSADKLGHNLAMEVEHLIADPAWRDGNRVAAWQTSHSAKLPVGALVNELEQRCEQLQKALAANAPHCCITDAVSVVKLLRDRLHEV